MERKEYLKKLLNKILKDVEEIMDLIFCWFSEDEREEEEIKEYIDALLYIEDVINYINFYY